MSAEAALQTAIFAALTGDGGVQAKVGDRVYDRVPANAVLPYVHMRDFASSDLPGACTDSLEIFVSIDVWSDRPGKIEAATIAGLVVRALHEAELPLDAPYVLVDLRRRSVIVEASEVPNTSRARLTFVALVDNTAD